MFLGCTFAVCNLRVFILLLVGSNTVVAWFLAGLQWDDPVLEQVTRLATMLVVFSVAAFFASFQGTDDGDEALTFLCFGDSQIVVAGGPRPDLHGTTQI